MYVYIFIYTYIYIYTYKESHFAIGDMVFISFPLSPSASYTVKFYDGVIQTVKGIHVKPFIKEVHVIY